MFTLREAPKRWIELVVAMTVKEISSRYKLAVFGFLWILINPILQMIVTGVIFQFFITIKGVNYFEYLFPGLLVWNFFSFTITKSTLIFMSERQLIQKANFPREVLVLSVVLSNLFHFLIAFVLFVLWEALVVLEWHWWRWCILPLAMLWLTVLTSGISLLTSSLNVKWRDVNFIVQGTVSLLFYATPIIYSLDSLPYWLMQLIYLNPLTGIVEIMRWITLGTEIHWSFVGIGLITTVFIFWFGVVTFNREKPFFDDWL